MSSSKKPNSSPSIRHLVSSSCISCLVFKPPSFAEPLPICVRGCTLHSPQDAQHCLNLRCIPGPNRGRQQPWGDSCGRHTINSQQPLMYVVYTSLSTYVYTYNYLYMYHRIWQVVSEDVRQLLSEHQHLQKKRNRGGLLHISATTLHNLPGQQLITDLPKPQNAQRFSRRSSPKMGCVD